MKKNAISSIFLALCLAVSSAQAVLSIPNKQPKVDESFWNSVLDKTWNGIKKRNIAPYEGSENGKEKVGSGLVHRPKSEYPGDAVSEAVGYGMIVALYSNDQETFNKIWEAANKNLWAGCYYDWQLKPNGTMGTGAATDAEEDVILMLIFADKLVQSGKWQDFTTSDGRKYMDHAKKMMSCMWSTDQITSLGTLAPGSGWGGDDFVNVGYFSPAWYKIFAQYDSDHDWKKVVDRSYEIIGNSPGYKLGMVPDWMTPEGKPTGSLGYNAYFDAKAFFKDAIRILWRVAMDAIWFDEPRAKSFLQNSMKFINSIGGAKAANFFQMDGSLLPAEDIWEDMLGGTITRHRREHSPLTIGMWSTAAMAAGSDDDKKSFSLEMAKFYDKDADYFGLAVDPSEAQEDTLHNEMYFEQFLGWFSTALMTGVFSNIVDDIDNPKTNVAGLKTELSLKKESDDEDGKDDDNSNNGKDDDKKDPTTIFANNTYAKHISITQSGKNLSFISSEDATWTIYSLNGKIVTNLQGSKVHWNAGHETGMFVVKMTDSHNQNVIKHFIVH